MFSLWDLYLVGPVCNAEEAVREIYLCERLICLLRKTFHEEEESYGQSLVKDSGQYLKEEGKSEKPESVTLTHSSSSAPKNSCLSSSVRRF